MYEDLIQKIYELRYEAIVTPQNLLENALLDNYEYVKYYKSDNQFMLFVEMKCVCEDLIARIFVYTFDEKKWLQKIETKEPNQVVLFDRDQNLNELLEEYRNKRTDINSCLAG